MSCRFSRPQRELVMVIIKLICWCLNLLDAPRHQLTCMHACGAAARLAMVDLSLDGYALSTYSEYMANKTLNGTMSACVPSAARFSANY